MTLLKTSIGRRALLRGLGWGAVGVAVTPLIRQLVRPARADGSAPKRALLVYAGNGFLPSLVPPDLRDENGRAPGGRFQRSDNTALLDMPFAQLPDAMAGLEPYRDRTMLLWGTYLGHAAGHYALYQGLTCVPTASNYRPNGVSFDRYLAGTIGQDTPMAHLPLAVVQSEEKVSVKAFSADGPDAPVPMRCKIGDTAALLFGAASEAEAATLSRGGHLIDLLRQDLSRVEAELVGDERIRAQQYAATLESVSLRADDLRRHREATPWCERPVLDGYDESLIEGRMEAMFDIAGAALACGLTRVVSLSLCSGLDFDAKYEGLGYTTGLHPIGHGGRDPEMGDDTAVHAFHSRLIARTCDTLAATDDGDGASAFDNTVVLWGNENGSAHHNREPYPWHFALVGDAGGRLRADGRWIRPPDPPNDGYMGVADLYSTIARALDALPPDAEHWQPDAGERPRGVVNELLT